MYTGLAQPEVKTNGLLSKNSTAFTSRSIRAVISATSALSAKCMGGANLSRLESAESSSQGDAMNKTKTIAAAALLLAPIAAHAQLMSYRCVGNDGKKYYGSTIPMQCMGKPIEQLNSQGRVVRRIDPDGEAKEKAEKAAAAAKAKEEEAATREESRRNRALLATYTSERDIDDARTRALQDNHSAVREVETKIDTLKKRRAGYDKELEFYQDKKGNTKPPAKLLEDIDGVSVDLKVQEELLAVKKKEVDNINAKYDQDKKRYLQLTRQSR